MIKICPVHEQSAMLDIDCPYCRLEAQAMAFSSSTQIADAEDVLRHVLELYTNDMPLYMLILIRGAHKILQGEDSK